MHLLKGSIPDGALFKFVLRFPCQAVTTLAKQRYVLAMPQHDGITPSILSADEAGFRQLSVTTQHSFVRAWLVQMKSTTMMLAPKLDASPGPISQKQLR
jgi:hypothetical protein